MVRHLSTKFNKVMNPLEITRRVDAYRAVLRGEKPKGSNISPLDPAELTSTQKNIVIEHLKHSEALSNVEIADYLKITRQTVASRLKVIDKEGRNELEEKGISVWEAVYELKRAVGYVKKRARILNDPDLYLRAVVTYINQCQKLGVVYEKPLEVDVNLYPQHSLEDEKLIIEHLRAEHRKTLQEIELAEKRNNAEIVELLPANSKS